MPATYHIARLERLTKELADALKAIHQGAEAQFKYLMERGRTSPHGSDGRILELQDCQWAGIHETDARHTYPNRLHLIDGVVEAALDRYKEEVGDGEDM